MKTLRFLTMVFGLCCSVLAGCNDAYAQRRRGISNSNPQQQAIDIIKNQVWNAHYTFCDGGWVTGSGKDVTQYRTVNFQASSRSLSSADSLNGIQWKGYVTASAPVYRTMRRDFTWNDWQNKYGNLYSIYLEKKNGNWNIGYVTESYPKISCAALTQAGASQMQRTEEINRKKQHETENEIEANEEYRKILPLDIKQSSVTYNQERSDFYTKNIWNSHIIVYDVKLNPRDVWFDTGIKVSDGMRIQIGAKGYVRWTEDPGLISQPDGVNYTPQQLPDSSGFPVADANCGSLVFKVGTKLFANPRYGNLLHIEGVGRNQTIKVMVNDRITGMDDNLGGFTIEIAMDVSQ